MRPDRHFFKHGNRFFLNTRSGSREGEAKFECFLWRDTLVPALACRQVRYREEVLIPRMPDVGRAFL